MESIAPAFLAALTLLSGSALLTMAPSLARATSIDGLGGQVFATGSEVFADLTGLKTHLCRSKPARGAAI